MKLTVNTLDNKVKSAVINIGTNGGYIEAYVDNSRTTKELVINFYNSGGNVFSCEVMPLELFTTKMK